MSDPDRSIEDGVRRLQEILDEAGMTYSEWVWSVESRTAGVAA